MVTTAKWMVTTLGGDHFQVDGGQFEVGSDHFEVNGNQCSVVSSRP